MLISQIQHIHESNYCCKGVKAMHHRALLPPSSESGWLRLRLWEKEVPMWL